MAGGLTRGQLRWNHTAVHPGVSLPNGVERTLVLNTVAAWLWTRRKGVIAGRAATKSHASVDYPLPPLPVPRSTWPCTLLTS
jgi:hypothetical protein